MKAWSIFCGMMALLLGLGEARAESGVIRALADDLPQLGTPLDEVRAMPHPGGRRMVCESDTDKPRLAKPGLMTQQRSRGADHVRRCALFVDDGTGTWTQATRDTVFGPARLWLIFVEQGSPGRHRLAQLSLWAKTAEWDKAAGLLGALLGEPSTRADRLLGLQDEQHETLMFIDEKFPDEFAVAIGDVRLRKLMKSPGTLIRE